MPSFAGSVAIEHFYVNFVTLLNTIRTQLLYKWEYECIFMVDYKREL